VGFGIAIGLDGLDGAFERPRMTAFDPKRSFTDRLSLSFPMRQEQTPYKVRRIQVVAKGADVLVREYTLDPGEHIPWHHHSGVADYYYGLEGTVVIETRNPAARHEVRAGQAAQVAQPTAHHVSNPTSVPCRFLLIQGVGQYDFVKEE